MTNEDRFANANWLSLPFKAICHIERVNDPGAVVVVDRTDTCLLLLRDGCVHTQTERWAKRLRADEEFLLKHVGVAFDLDFLTEANDVVVSKDVPLLGFLENEN